MRELSVVTGEKIANTDTQTSVLVLAGVRIIKLEELSERLGYENMVNWLLRFSGELTASMDLWRRGIAGAGEEAPFQLFRLESSLLIFPGRNPEAAVCRRIRALRLVDETRARRAEGGTHRVAHRFLRRDHRLSG